MFANSIALHTVKISFLFQTNNNTPVMVWESNTNKESRLSQQESVRCTFSQCWSTGAPSSSHRLPKTLLGIEQMLFNPSRFSAPSFYVLCFRYLCTFFFWESFSLQGEGYIWELITFPFSLYSITDGREKLSSFPWVVAVACRIWDI